MATPLAPPDPYGSLIPSYSAQHTVTVESLRPALRPAGWANTARLSDSGFSDAAASVPLSQSTAMALTSRCAAGSTLISHRDVDDLGLSLRQAWNASAFNLLSASHNGHSLRFHTRPASARLSSRCPQGVEVTMDGCHTTSWLAHPQTFTLLHEHMRSLLSSSNLVYLAPREDILFVLADTSFSEATAWAQYAAETTALYSALITFPLVWNNGFPKAFMP